MEAGAAANVAPIRGARGRKDGDGQEVVIEMKPVREVLQELLELDKKARNAAQRRNDAIKAVAKKSGLLSSVVRKLVNARAGEDFAEEKRKVDQLALVFEEIGDGSAAGH